MEGEDDVLGVPPAPEAGKPLLRAVFLRRLRLARLLLEGGAYVNESDRRGQTPLMVACRTQHVDAQSAGRARLVQYLLERGADPNIQDKLGRTALMHACLGQAGAGVVSLLLASGADPGLEDHSGSSALLYAVTAGDQEVLTLLLDACKAKGKEVIIITTDALPCGKPRARQHLSVPPLAPVGQGDGLHPSAAPPCASPSEVQLLTSPQCSSSSSSSCAPQQVFSFKQSLCSGCGGVSSQPCSPARARGPGWGRVDRLQQPLQRLNSEPWLRIPSSLLARQPSRAPSSTEDLPDFSPEEDLSIRINRLGWNAEGNDNGAPLRCKCGTERKENNADPEVKDEETRGLLRRKLSLSGLFSSHSTSHPNLHSQSLNPSPGSPYPFTSTGGKDSACPLPSLRSIIQRCHLGADHYSSDPQLAVQTRGFPEEGRGPLESRRLVSSRSSTLLSSREFLETMGLTRIAHSGLERRGSGALLLDHISQTRPGCLPPLNPHYPPIPNISGGTSSNAGHSLSSSLSALGGSQSSRAACGAVAGLRPLLPSAPPGLPRELRTRRMLLRRHSMQTEQITQLGDFDGIFGH